MGLLISMALCPALAQAGGGIFSPGSFSNPADMLSPGFVNAVVKTIGLASDNRAYEPATPLGKTGLDLSLSATLAQIPGEFNDALAATSGSSGGSIPFLPVPVLSIHKGLGASVDGGASYINYQNFRVLGFDLKIVLSQPEEGPTTALRLNYTTTDILMPDTITAEISTWTYKPELLFSRQLDFADPYIGFGYEYATGKIDLSTTFPIPLTQSASGRGGTFYAFTGVSLRVVPLGLRMTMEGAYSRLGVNALGLKMGMSF